MINLSILVVCDSIIIHAISLLNYLCALQCIWFEGLVSDILVKISHRIQSNGNSLLKFKYSINYTC